MSFLKRLFGARPAEAPAPVSPDPVSTPPETEVREPAPVAPVVAEAVSEEPATPPSSRGQRPRRRTAAKKVPSPLATPAEKCAGHTKPSADWPKPGTKQEKIIQLYREGLSYKEIAARVGTSEANVGMCITKARRMGIDLPFRSTSPRKNSAGGHPISLAPQAKEDSHEEGLIEGDAEVRKGEAFTTPASPSQVSDPAAVESDPVSVVPAVADRDAAPSSAEAAAGADRESSSPFLRIELDAESRAFLDAAAAETGRSAHLIAADMLAAVLRDDHECESAPPVTTPEPVRMQEIIAGLSTNSSAAIARAALTRKTTPADLARRLLEGAADGMIDAVLDDGVSG